MEILILSLHLLLLTALSSLSYRRQQGSALAVWYLPTLGLRILAAIALGLVYSIYYEQGDTFVLWQKAGAIAARMSGDLAGYGKYLLGFHTDFVQGLGMEEQPRVRFFAGGLSLLHFLTGGNYWLAGAWLAWLSHRGLFAFAQQLLRTVSVPRLAPVIAFLLWPSVLFWGSGVLKESLLLAGMGFCLALFLPCYREEKWPLRRVLPMLMLLGLLFLLKYYYGAVLAVCLIATYLVQVLEAQFFVLMGNTRRLWRIWLLVFAVLLFVASSLHPNLQPEYFPEALLKNNAVVLAASSEGAALHYYDLEATWGSIFLNSPLAFVYGLFRPLPGEVNSLFGWLASAENLLLLALLLTTLFAAKRQMEARPMLLVAVLVFVLVMGVLLPLAAPNMGALSRYRVGYLPFIVLILLTASARLRPWLGPMSVPETKKVRKRPGRTS